MNQIQVNSAHEKPPLDAPPESIPGAVIVERAEQPAPAAEQQHYSPAAYSSLLEAARSLASVLVVALFILTFIIQPFRIPSESMERTLLVGDFLLVNKQIFGPPGIWGWLLPYKPVQHGDIIIFHFPLNPGEYLVKRVIGTPGDAIHLHNGTVYRNDQPIKEPYAVYEKTYPDNFRDQFPAMLYTDPGVDTRWWLEMRRITKNGNIVVPPHSYFAMGDNRNNSRDSRYWGFVPRQNIEGRPLLIYFSLRVPSHTDVPDLPDDKLGHENSPLSRIVDFARWDRMFRIVR